MKNHNIRLSDKRLKAFLVKINNIKFYQFSSLMVNIQSPVSATVIKKTNKNNMHLKVVKLSLFIDVMLFHVYKPKYSTRKAVRTNKHIQHSCRIQNQHMKITYIFYLLTMNTQKRKLRK